MIQYMSKEWDEQLEALRLKYADNPWNPYNPRFRSGWTQLSQNEGLACVLCSGLSKVVEIADNQITIACDQDNRGIARNVIINPDPGLQGGGSISPDSTVLCPLKLIYARS